MEKYSLLFTKKTKISPVIELENGIVPLHEEEAFVSQFVAPVIEVTRSSPPDKISGRNRNCMTELEIDSSALQHVESLRRRKNIPTSERELEEINLAKDPPTPLRSPAKFRRLSIVPKADIAVAKFLSTTFLRDPLKQSQAQKNLNRMGPAVATARIANLIAKIIMLSSIAALLIAYFLVVTQFLK